MNSRFAATRHIRACDEEALVRQLDDMGRQLGCRWVMTIGESDILMLQRRAGDLRAVKPIIPDTISFHKVLDKSVTFAEARKIGIRVPRSWSVASLEQLALLRAELPFPLVLKWSNPHDVAAKLQAAGLPLDKYRYVYSFKELVEYLARFESVGQMPLIQEFCGGTGLGQMVFMYQGQPVQRFQHARLLEMPPEGGVSAVCRSLAPDLHAGLMAKSIELLRRLEWSGPAMVEYRYDAASGQACLMEVNGRFWGSMPLAYHANAEFAWLAYQVGTGAVPEHPTPYRVGIQCRYAAPEIKRLLILLFSPSRIQNRDFKFSRFRELARFVLLFLDPRTRYYVFSLTDPRPFLIDVVGMIRRRLHRLII
ncbi:MAG: carboxylate--amine ligase [Gammaproteobacteria bacterium]